MAYVPSPVLPAPRRADPADADGVNDRSQQASARRVPSQRPWLLPTMVGAFATVVTGAGMWVPSLWGDEAASIMSAQRPWPSLFRMLGNIDAVHGTYYVLLHVWIDVFGASTFSVRLLSVLAVGLAAAGVVVIARRLGGARLALVAGIVFALLPRTSYMSAEARSYALSATVAVWLTVLFVALIERRVTRWMPWVAYALALAFGVYLFLYLALLAIVHAVVLVQVRPTRTVVGRWCLAVAAAGVLALPVVGFAYAERDQIAFLGWTDPVTPYTFFVSQWFGGNETLAVLCWALVAVAVVAAALGWRRARAGARARGGAPSLSVLAFAWFALPPLLLLVADRFEPLYTLRYTSFVAPALAIVLAIGMLGVARAASALLRASRSRFPGAWRARSILAGGLVLALAAVASPTLVAQRSPFAKDLGSDWAQVADIMRNNARPGDAVAFTQEGRPSRSPRLAMHLYPDAFEGLRDVTLTSPYEQNLVIWDHTRSIAHSSGALAGGDGRLWLIQYEGPKSSPSERIEQFVALRMQGYELVQVIPAHRDTVYLFEDERNTPRPTGLHDKDQPLHESAT